MIPLIFLLKRLGRFENRPPRAGGWGAAFTHSYWLFFKVPFFKFLLFENVFGYTNKWVCRWKGIFSIQTRKTKLYWSPLLVEMCHESPTLKCTHTRFLPLTFLWWSLQNSISLPTHQWKIICTSFWLSDQVTTKLSFPLKCNVSFFFST